MYTEKDNSGMIIIQNISKEEARSIVDALCSYLSEKPIKGRTDMERSLIMLKVELEKMY